MKELAGYLAYRVASAVIGVLPPSWLPVIGRLGGRLAFTWSGPRRRLAERHMRRAGVEGDPRAAAREVFANYGRYWVEVFWIRPRRLRELQDSVSVEGLEHILGARDRGAGVILALPHVGNWEVAGPVGKREGLGLTAVAEALPNQRITEWFVRLRRSLGIDILLTDGRSDLVRELFVRLRRGETVALVADRDVTGRGHPVRFFGEETTLPSGPVTLSRRTGAPIIPVAVYFKEGWGHKAVVRPPLELPAASEGEAGLGPAMEVLAEALEELIAEAPTQWHLVQPNWPSDRR